MWDAIILGGKQSLLPFEIFEDLQHTYSWMKYYNNELYQTERTNGQGQAALIDTLNEVKESMNQSLKLLKQGN